MNAGAAIRPLCESVIYTHLDRSEVRLGSPLLFKGIGIRSCTNMATGERSLPVSSDSTSELFLRA